MSAANNFKTWVKSQVDSDAATGFALSDDLRSTSLDILNSGRFPTRKDEEWRYTPLKNVLDRKIETQLDIHLDTDLLKKLEQAVPDAHRLVFLNGILSSELSDHLSSKLRSGIRINELEKLDAVSLQRAEAIIREAHLSDENIFQHVTLGLTQSGLFIELDDNYKFDTPLHLIYLSSDSPAVSCSNPLCIINMGKHSQLKIIQQFASTAHVQAITIPAEFIQMDEAAHLDRYTIIRESAETDHISNTSIKLGNSAHLYSHQYLMGSRLTRTNLEVCFAGTGAKAILQGLYLGNDSQHLDLRTYMDHAHPDCTSDQHFRGIMNDSSRGVFNGMVLVREHAQRTDAQQSNKNLLLSRNAGVDTKPQLEIFADDVKCTHGATIGELDEDALFYLQSRGISKQDAALMLTHAFAAEIIDNISLDSLREYLQNIIANKLSGLNNALDSGLSEAIPHTGGF